MSLTPHVRRTRLASTLLGGLAVVLGFSSAYSAPSDPFGGALPAYDAAAPKGHEAGTGEAGVSSVTGAATYAYPIPVPPGRNGMAPSLSLNYSSQAPTYGGLAAGWSLSLGGVDVIELDPQRHTALPILPGEHWPKLGSKSYLAGGAELVPVADDPIYYRLPPPASEIRTVTQTFRAAFDASHTRYGFDEPKNQWVARTSDGRVRVYGFPDGVRWRLIHEEDFFGNYVTYDWNSSFGGTFAMLTEVRYGAHRSGSLVHHARIELVQNPPVICKANGVPVGATIDRGTLLGAQGIGQIVVWVKETQTGSEREARRVLLGYDASESCAAATPPMRLLKQITMRGRDKNGASLELPPVKFSYGERTRGFGTTLSKPAGIDYPEKGRHASRGTRDQMLMDVDGDGLQDLMTSTMVNGVCGATVRKGLLGGGFGETRAIALPSVPWAEGSLPKTYFPDSPATMIEERCSLNGQVVARINNIGSCGTQTTANVIGYHWVDWNADGHLDLLTNVWGGTPDWVGAELEGVTGYQPTSSVVQAGCPENSSYTVKDQLQTILTGEVHCTCDAGFVPSLDGSACLYPDICGFDCTPSPGGGGDWGDIGNGGGFGSGGPDGPNTCSNLAKVYPERGSSTNALWRVYLNTGAEPMFGAPRDIHAPAAMPPPVSRDELRPPQSDGVPDVQLPQLVDFNGDGYLDFVYAPIGDASWDDLYGFPAAKVPSLPYLHVYLGNGTSSMGHAFYVPKPTWSAWPEPQQPSGQIVVDTGADLRDMNSDGKPDLVVVHGGRIHISWNRGTHFENALVDTGMGGPIESQVTYLEPNKPPLYAPKAVRQYTRRLLDVDGDGLPDLVTFNAPASASAACSGARVFYNQGSSFAPGVDIATLSAACERYVSRATSVTTSDWRLESTFVDVDGNGVADALRWDAGGPSYTDATASAPLRLLKTIDNGRGAVTTIGYRSSSDPAVRLDDGPMRHPMPVVASLTVSPHPSQLAVVTTYEYGRPRYQKVRGGASGFVGFENVATTAPRPAGATGAAMTLQTFDFRLEDGGAELTEEIVLEAVGSKPTMLPASITRPTYKRLRVLNKIDVSVTESSVTRTCFGVAQATFADCWAKGVRREVRSEFKQFPATGIAKLWYTGATTEESSTETTDARRVESVPVILYGSWSKPDYRVLPGAEKVFRRGGHAVPTWEQRGQTVISYDGSGLPTWTYAYTGPGSAPIAATKREFDATTGNLTAEIRPRQSGLGAPLKTAYAYVEHKIFPGTVTNELGHAVAVERDVTTGTPTRQLGPNVKWVWPATCTGRCMVQMRWDEDTWTLDPLGRVTSHSAAFDDPVAGYALYEIERTLYSDPVGMGPTIEAWSRLSLTADEWTKSQRFFDGLGRVFAERQLRQEGAGVTDPMTLYFYDAAGQLERIEAPDPQTQSARRVPTVFARDSLGRPIRVTRPDGSGVEVSYGGFGPASAPAEMRTVREFGPNAASASNVFSVTDGVYDGYGRLVMIRERDNPAAGQNSDTFYAYDHADRLEVVHSPDVTTTLTHDWLGRRTKIDRGGRIWEYRYDVDGNLTAEIAPVPAGKAPVAYTSVTEYDVLGRPTLHRPGEREMTSSTEGQQLAIGPTHYTYDEGANGKGQLTKVVQPRGGTLPDYLKVTLAYDASGAVLREERAFNPRTLVSAGEAPLATMSVERTYTPNGLPLTAKWDDGQSWFMTYDKRGLTKKVEWAASYTGARTVVADIQRSVTGAPLTRTATSLGNQVRTFTYDALGRPKTDVLTAGGLARFDRTYTFSDSGDIKSVAGSNKNGTTTLANAGASFTYDARHRIKSSTGPGSHHAQYKYSATGNLLEANVAGPASVNPRNVRYDYEESAYGPYTDPQAVSELVNLSDGTTLFASFKYDASGNLTERRRGAGATPAMTLRWDGDDQLVQVGGDALGGVTENYHYDHAGQRVWAHSAGKVRFWFAEVELEMSMSGGVTYRYLHVPDGAGGMLRSEKIGTLAPALELHYSDLTQNLIMSLGPGGAIEAHFTYSAFGEVVYAWDTTGAGDHRRRFNGKEDDRVSGLRYYGARYYDPLAMRWTAMDPLYSFLPDRYLAQRQQHNLYAFSKNNPVRFLDPNGLEVPLGPALDCAKRGERCPVPEEPPPEPMTAERALIVTVSIMDDPTGIKGRLDRTAEQLSKGNVGAAIGEATGLNDGLEMLGHLGASIESGEWSSAVVYGVAFAASAVALWKSVPKFGHSFLKHGMGAKITSKLKDTAKTTNTPQGQWLDNDKAAEILDGIRADGPTTIKIPGGVGQVIMPDGSIVPAKRAIVVPGPKGIKTSYPVL